MYAGYTSHRLLFISFFSFLYFTGIVESALIGELCGNSTECLSDNTYSVCANNSCECIHPLASSENGSSHCKALVGDDCRRWTSPKLLPKYSECAKKTVKCLPNYYTQHMLCHKGNISIGGNCSTTKQCADPNANCTENVCNCTNGVIKVNGTVYCARGVGKLACSVSEMCFKDSICVDQQCTCNLGYYRWKSYHISDFGCRDDPGSINQYCAESSDCPGDRTECKFGRCGCKLEHYYRIYHVIVEHGIKRCALNVTNFGSCKRYDRIKFDGAECKNNTVICKPGYRTLPRFCCKDVAIPVKQACSADFQCQYLDNNTECFYGKCHCKKEFSHKHISGRVKCVRYVALNETCDNVINICNDGNRICQNGNCTCNPGYHSLKGAYFHCEVTSDTDTSNHDTAIICGSVGGVVLFIIIISVIAVKITRKHQSVEL